MRAIREIEAYKYPSLFSYVQQMRGRKGGGFWYFSYSTEEEFQSESEIKSYQNIQTSKTQWFGVLLEEEIGGKGVLLSQQLEEKEGMRILWLHKLLWS